MNDFTARIHSIAPRFAPLGSLPRSNDGTPIFRREGEEAIKAIFVYDARRDAMIVSQPIEDVTTATRATRCSQARYNGDERVRVVRDRTTGKLGVQAA